MDFVTAMNSVVVFQSVEHPQQRIVLACFVV